MKKRVGVVFKEEKPEAKKLGLEVKRWLEKRDCEVFLKLTDKVLKEGLSFIVTLGGDGLVLHTADRVAEFKIPLFRVNFGRMGYLCDVKPDEVFEKLTGKFDYEQRTRIQAEVFQKGKLVKKVDALNEIAIGGINRTVSVVIEVLGKKKNFVAEIRGDGVIFSTKTGSTAYNIYAGGSVLLTDVFSVVANNAFFDSDFLLPNTKAFVTSTEAVFELKSLDLREAQLPYLIADGQRNYRLKAGDLVKIKRSQTETKFVKVV